MGWYFTKAFSVYKKGLGLTRERTGFHSLRGNVATALEQAGVVKNAAAEILGHEKDGITYGLYSEGLTPMQRKEIIERITYPELDLAHLHAPSFDQPQEQRPARRSVT